MRLSCAFKQKIIFEYKYLKGDKTNSSSDYKPPNPELKSLLQENFELNDCNHPHQ